MYSRRKIFLILSLALMLIGCSSQGPKLIAEYPAGNQPESHEKVWSPMPEFRLVYYAFLVLEVANLDRAASNAEAIAYESGGYLVRSDSWNREGRKQVTLVFAVPMPNFEEFRRSLLNLGKLQNERVWGEWMQRSPGNLPNYAEVTLQLQSRSLDWPSLPFTGWNPERTFRQALEVFVTIFGFLVDILIWLGVVLGPFVVLAWLGWRLVMRLKRKC